MHGPHRGTRRRTVGPERAARRAERREELLEAAATVVRDRPGSSMAGIAAAAGVTKPILYRHFGDRRGLVLALAERFAAGLTAELEAALAHGDGAAPQELLATTLDVYLGFVERDPGLYRFLVQQAMGEEAAARSTLLGLMRSVADRVGVVLGDRLALAGADARLGAPLAHGIVGMVFAAGDWWVEQGWMSREGLGRSVADLLWHGLAGMGLDSEPGESRPAQGGGARHGVAGRS
jgi:AcrR family transcriptional regulator